MSLEHYPLLSRVNSPHDLKQLTVMQLTELAQELRHYLLHALNISGGHFSANLGAVELTLALHYVFDTPADRLVWDVGHQAYVHKILTGRCLQLPTIRQLAGLAPFPVREESEYDAFGVGHSSTSVSAALGMVLAGAPGQVVAVIGDGAMTAGLAYEAMNHAGQLQANIKIILNDNEMSISQHDACVVSPLFFTAMKFHYAGPVDGHDLPALIQILQDWKAQTGPQVLHVRTKKGKGYAPAEQDAVKYHAVLPDYLKESHDLKGVAVRSTAKSLTYSQVFGEWICAMAQVDSRLLAITPAMTEGSGLVAFRQKFSERFFDVGIAEQHAVTLAAGMACEGKKPVVAIYSTFLQRAYDQLIHDVALQNLPVLFAIDRAGIVGGDGATHQGEFDLSYLRCIPNLIIMAPADEQTCWDMLTLGFLHDGPAAVRYPRGQGLGREVIPRTRSPLHIGKAEVVREGQTILMLSFGSLLQESLKAAEILNATVVEMRFIKPLDERLIAEQAAKHQFIVTLEENVIAGGAGGAVSEYLAKIHYDFPHLLIGLPDQFIAHGDPNLLRKQYGLDAASIAAQIKLKMKEKK